MQRGQHSSRGRRRGADRAAERTDLRRITSISAAVVAGVAVTTTAVAGIGGAGSAAADTSAPVGFFVLSDATPLPTAAPTGKPDAAQADTARTRVEAPTAQPTAGPTAGPTDAPNAAAPNTTAPTAAPNAGRPTAGPTGPAAAPNIPATNPQTPQETPELRITLSYERRDRDLVITLTFAGYVFRPYSSRTGQIEEYPIPAKRDIGLYEHLDWGDGTSYTAPAKAQRCPAGAEKRMVHEVADRYQLKKKYRKGGDYLINYEYDACGLTNGKIAGQIKMHVP